MSRFLTTSVYGREHHRLEPQWGNWHMMLDNWKELGKCVVFRSPRQSGKRVWLIKFSLTSTPGEIMPRAVFRGESKPDIL